jgi:putative ABC transport system permease protein
VMKEEAFVSSWIDDDLREWHNPASSVSVLGFLAFITITIATMGLLGLVVYTVETKRKEISIRKIVGATAAQVTYLLSKGFTSLLMVSGLIALPVGYVLSEMFLYNFTNRISIGIETLITCFGILLVIGLTTILSQTYQAAQENPAGNLRSE